MDSPPVSHAIPNVVNIHAMNCHPALLLSSLALSLAVSLPAAETATTGGDKITDPAQVLANIPRDVFKDLRYGSRDIEAATIKATAQMRKNSEGKTGSFKMTVGVVEQFQRKDTPDITRTRLKQTNEIIREGGAAMRVYLVAVMDEGEKAKFAKIAKGSKVTVTGMIENAEIITNKEVELHINLKDAKLE